MSLDRHCRNDSHPDLQAACRALHHRPGEVMPLVGFASQGSGEDEDVAAAATGEPLPGTVAEELDGSPPGGPPLPIPTVASERGVTPVSGVEAQRFAVACLTEAKKKGWRPGRDLPLAGLEAGFILVHEVPHLGI